MPLVSGQLAFLLDIQVFLLRISKLGGSTGFRIRVPCFLMDVCSVQFAQYCFRFFFHGTPIQLYFCTGRLHSDYARWSLQCCFFRALTLYIGPSISFPDFSFGLAELLSIPSSFHDLIMCLWAILVQLVEEVRHGAL